MEENKVMNDDQLEKVVGGVTQKNVIEAELMRVFAVHGLTPAQVFALADEEKQKVFAELGLSSNFDVFFNLPTQGHGMKEFQ